MSDDVRLFEDFELNRSAYSLTRHGEVIHLERIPLELLSLLVQRRGEMVSRDEILEHIWGKGVFIDNDNAINTAIRKIRRALNDDAGDPRFIVTVSAKGYRFIAPVKVGNGEPNIGTNLEPISNSNGDSVEFALSAPAVGPTQPHHSNSRRTALLSIATMALVAGVIIAAPHFSLKALYSEQSISLQHSQPLPFPPLDGKGASGVTPMPGIPSVAVLPLTNLSGDPAQAYFCDGLTDYIITNLSRIPGLFVIARNSSFIYKNKAVAVQQVGRELGVRFVLQGSVLRAGDRVQINLQLADAVSGTNRWGQTFERPWKDLLAMRDDILGKVVTTVGLFCHLHNPNIPHLTDLQATENLDAFDDDLRGVEYFMRQTKRDNAKARALFAEAIKLDPRYADAYA